MNYKFDFVQHDAVPREHIERDRQFWKQRGMDEICTALLRDFSYIPREKDDGKIQYGIELSVLKTANLRQAISSIERILSYNPAVLSDVLSILETMQLPDNLEYYDTNSLQ